MATDYNYAGKVVLTTGSSGGLGEHISKEFAKRGATVVITGRRKDAVERVACECHRLSPSKAEPLPFVADVTKPEQRKALIDAIIAKYGRLDVLVNSAGGGAFSSIYDPKLLETLDHMWELDVKAVVALTQLAVPHLEKTKGNVVNISAVLAEAPNVHFMPYCTAKAALNMFSRCISVELGPKGVRVNSVSPTAIRTNFQAAAGGGDGLQAVLKRLEETIPLRRIATVEDVANAILFLSSEKASFVNGANLVVDGGNLNMSAI